MASYNELNALIDAYINRNGVQAITGQILNGVLKAMVEQLGRGYTIMGAAIPTTDPGTPDGPECYFASETGTYTDFDGLQVVPGELALLCYTPSDGWAKATIYEGFQDVQATIDGNVGTPSVGVSYANGVLSFDFHNMKGNPGQNGQDGAAAGFGTISADIAGGVGTPAVSVESSGPATAKNLQFHFTNLKGETGVTSVVATVDNTTGTPACTVSLEGQQLTLAFSGLKGAQGNTGSSVEFPYELVNNLTTNDATKGLSAAQGYVLDGKVSQLKAKVDEKFIDDYDLATISDKIAVQGYYNTASWTVGNVITPSVVSNQASAIYSIHVVEGDTISVKLYNNYTGFSWYAILDDNNILVEKSTDNTVGNKEKIFAIAEDGTLIINLYNGSNYFGDISIKKLTEVSKEARLYEVSIDGTKATKFRGEVALPLTELVREINQSGKSAVITKTITATELWDYGFYGYFNSSGLKYAYIPASASTEVSRMVKEYCLGYRYVYLPQNTYNSGFMYGAFTDKDGAVIQKLSWYHDAVPQGDGTYRVEVPEGAMYAYIWTYGDKAALDSFSARMEMVLDAPNAEEAPKYKMYKKTVTNGLRSLFVNEGYTSELIPVDFLDFIEFRTIHNVSGIQPFDKDGVLFNANAVVIKSTDYVEEEGGVKKYSFGIYSHDVKFIKFLMARKPYGTTTNKVTNTELTIYRGIPSSQSEFTRGEMSFVFPNPYTYSGASFKSLEGTPIFNVSPFDTVTHLANSLPTKGVDIYATGLYFYDENFQIVGYGKKMGEPGTYVTDVVPDGAVYGQLITAQLSNANDYPVCEVNRVSPVKEVVNVRDDVRSGVPFSRLIQENKGAELVDIGENKNLYVGYTSNCSPLIAADGSYIVFGGWAEVYRYNTKLGAVLWMKKSIDKGRTWSKMRILLDTIAFTPDANNVVYMHSPSAVVGKNGRILLQFTLDNTQAVNEALGDVEGASSTPAKRVCLIYSDDNGETWSEITDLTKYIIAKYETVYSVFGSYGRCYCTNGAIVFSFYNFKATSSSTAKGLLLYSFDDGGTWDCEAYQELNNETSICEAGDNNLLIVVRGNPGTKNKKEVFWLNMSNGLGELVYDQKISDRRVFNEASGYGEECEYGEVKRIRMNDHWAFLFAMQADDTKNITLFASHNLTKMIPVHNLWTPENILRAYSFMDVRGHEILCCNRTANEVVVHICNGSYSAIEGVGISEEVKDVEEPLSFSENDEPAVLASKLNELVQLMQANGYMKGWRDYTNKMGFASESQPGTPYNGYVSAGTNQGVMYTEKAVEGGFRIRIILPVQNLASGATSVKFSTRWNSGSSNHDYNAQIVSTEDGFVTAEYSGDNLAYGECLYVWYYNGVQKSAATTDGVRVFIYE